MYGLEQRNRREIDSAAGQAFSTETQHRPPDQQEVEGRAEQAGQRDRHECACDHSVPVRIVNGERGFHAAMLAGANHVSGTFVSGCRSEAGRFTAGIHQLHHFQVFTNFTTFTNWCYNGDHEARYCDHP